MRTHDGSGLLEPIERVEISYVSVPLVEPLHLFGTTVITHRDFIFARAYAGGLVGTGFGLTRGAGVDAIARAQIVPLVVGQPVGAIRQIWTNIRNKMRFFGESGAFARALSAVDIALWDLFGQTLKAPLWRIWGGAMPSVPCLAITGYYRAERMIETLRDEAEQLRKAGYTQYKVPVGNGLATDIKRLEALREAVGPEARIALDAHGSYDSVKDVITAIKHFEPFNIAFFEDPLPASNWSQVRDVAERSAIPIAYGENADNLQILQLLGGDHGIDILRPDATYHLGVTGFMQVVHVALENRKSVFPHYFPDIHAQLMGGLGGGWIEESPAESDTVNFQALRGQQPRIIDGMWQLDESPGFGFTWNEENLARYTVAP